MLEKPKKHTSELALDKCQINLRIHLEAKYKILQKYGDGSGDLRLALLKMIDQETDGVLLTTAAMRKITAEMQANYEKRMFLREERGLRAKKPFKDYSSFKRKPKFRSRRRRP